MQRVAPLCKKPIPHTAKLKTYPCWKLFALEWDWQIQKDTGNNPSGDIPPYRQNGSSSASFILASKSGRRPLSASMPLSCLILGTGRSKLNNEYQVMKRTRTERTRETKQHTSFVVDIIRTGDIVPNVSNILVGFGQIWTTLLNHILPRPQKSI